MSLFDCCKDCVEPKRHLGCHSTCKEYLESKAKLEKKKEARRTIIDSEYIGSWIKCRKGQR